MDVSCYTPGRMPIPKAEINRVIFEHYVDMRQKTWWMMIIPVFVIATFGTLNEAGLLLWYILGGQIIVSIADQIYFKAQLGKPNAIDQLTRRPPTLIFAALSGALLGAMMLPFKDTLGSSNVSAFACTALTVTIFNTSSISAPRKLANLAYLAGFFAIILPQALSLIPIAGLMPVFITIGVIPVMLMLAKSVREKERRVARIQIENIQLSETLAANLKASEELAKRDPLTGLLNRRAFELEANTFLETASEDGINAIIVMDLDHFKSINDRFGHAVGDHVLERTADCLRGVITLLGADNAICGRWGGEEFVLLVKAKDFLAATQHAEKLRMALEVVGDASWPEELLLTGSFGIAIWSPDKPLQSAIQAADQAMYKAKESGRNRTRAAHAIGFLPLEFLERVA